MRARTGLWEPWGGNAPGPPGPHARTVGCHAARSVGAGGPLPCPAGARLQSNGAQLDGQYMSRFTGPMRLPTLSGERYLDGVLDCRDALRRFLRGWLGQGWDNTCSAAVRNVSTCRSV